MIKALSELVARLQEDVPARDSVPSASQYENAVKDAVSDFSRRAGRTKIATLFIVSGTSTYDLPSDFIKLITLESLFTPDKIIISSDGIIPVSATWEETWTVADGQITFYPEPTYNLSRDIEYQAGWVLASDQYQEFGDTEAGIVLQLASALSLTLQANKAAQEAWQYAIGDERVNKERLAEALRAQAKENRDGYNAALKTYTSGLGGTVVGMRSEYTPGEYT